MIIGIVSVIMKCDECDSEVGSRKFHNMEIDTLGGCTSIVTVHLPLSIIPSSCSWLKKQSPIDKNIPSMFFLAKKVGYSSLTLYEPSRRTW